MWAWVRWIPCAPSSIVTKWLFGSFSAKTFPDFRGVTESSSPQISKVGVLIFGNSSRKSGSARTLVRVGLSGDLTAPQSLAPNSLLMINF